MHHDRKLQSILNQLTLSLETEHFVLRYGLRNPELGQGLGLRGVRDREYVEHYARSLEKLYNIMTQDLGRRAPRVGVEGKTLVYVFNIVDFTLRFDDPFTDVDNRGVPYIGERRLFATFY